MRRTLRPVVWLMALALGVNACSQSRIARPATAMEAANELLAADRRLAAAAQRSGNLESIVDAFGEGVWLQAGSAFVTGRDSARAALERGPAGIPYWEPVRGGVSADGTHGYTFGYLSIRTDSASVPMKYLAYWIKGGQGWRIQVYRRVAAPTAPGPMVRMAPSLPASWGATLADAEGAARAIRDAESAFSARAGVVGLREAFREYGAPDAMNMGGPRRATFVIGPDSIADAVSAGAPPGPSNLTWGSDHVLAAPSGDLGVSIGHINIPGPPAARIPFFTIWRRDGLGAPWRYVAE